MSAAFEELGLCPELICSAEEKGWSLPTAIQAEAVPLILTGGDVLAAAETGSGKTGAFALPLLQIVHETLRGVGRGDRSVGGEAPVPGAPADPDAGEMARSSSSAIPAAAATAGPTTLDPDDRDASVALDASALVAQSRDERGWAGVRATRGVSAGRAAFRATLLDDGLARFGWSSARASLDLGTDALSWGYGATGAVSHAGRFDVAKGEGFGRGDVVDATADLDAAQIRFAKNGVDLGVALPIPPELAGVPLFPAICMRNAEVKVDFFEGPIPPAGSCGAEGAAPTSASAAAPASAPPPPVSASTPLAGHPHSVERVVAASELSPQGAPRGPLALVLEPTGELAGQTGAVLAAFATSLLSPPLSTAVLSGGQSASQQRKLLREAPPDVVTGTPGRLAELAESGALRIDQVRLLVLDEADALLEGGNRDPILRLWRRLPKSAGGASRLQALLFSATLKSPAVLDLAAALCQRPTLIDLAARDASPAGVAHALVQADPELDRTWLQSRPAVRTDGIHSVPARGAGPSATAAAADALVSTPEGWSEAVKRLKPRLLLRAIQVMGIERGIVFCRTNYDCENLKELFDQVDSEARTERPGTGEEVGASGTAATADAAAEPGRAAGAPDATAPPTSAAGAPGREPSRHACAVLGGAKSASDRAKALDAFRSGEVRFLLATDVAARGIDVKELPFAINMTLPEKAADYVHRAGRVGRAGAAGVCLTIAATKPEKVWDVRGKGVEGGKKPWLNPTEANTRLAEEGGSAAWLDEPERVRAVERLLGQELHRLDESMSLDAVPGYGLASGLGTEGGTAADPLAEARARIDRAQRARLEALRPTAEALERLERAAQDRFFDLKRKWRDVGAR